MQERTGQKRHGLKSKMAKVAVLLIGVMLLGVVGCAKTPTASQDTKPIELKLAHFWPSTHPIETQLVQPWAKDIELATNGKVKVVSYPGETLVKSNDIYDGVVNGVSDIGISCFAYTRGRFPVLEVFELPGITYNNSKVASNVAWEGIQTLNPKEVQDTKLMMVITTGPGDLFTKTPVRTLADIKGMEIRATGLSAKTLQALGASPIGMAQSEAYESLSKGVVKGNLGPVEVLQGWKQAEVTKYITKTPFLYNTLFFVTMNKDKWNSLSPEVQAAIEKVNKKYFDDVASGLWDKQDADAMKYAVDQKGMQAITLSDSESKQWIDLVTPVQGDFVTAMTKQSLNGQEIIDQVKALAAKYNALYK
ncbi:MAG: TRAP transporter substrate-binding protein [Firmicutes bacterium]|nr:TRAP transporter substrate-binding protein [Bacillota bacterium]